MQPEKQAGHPSSQIADTRPRTHTNKITHARTFAEHRPTASNAAPVELHVSGLFSLCVVSGNRRREHTVCLHTNENRQPARLWTLQNTRIVQRWLGAVQLD